MRYEARCELSFVLMIVGLAQVVIALVTTKDLFSGWLVIGLGLILASVVWMPVKDQIAYERESYRLSKEYLERELAA